MRTEFGKRFDAMIEGISPEELRILAVQSGVPASVFEAPQPARLADRLAFRLLDIAVWLDKPVWSQHDWAFYHEPEEPWRSLGCLYAVPDGWRPVRYM